MAVGTYTRQCGEFLHPEHEPAHVLIELKREMGPIAFSAQYWQTPIPPGGTIIKRKWLTTYDEIASQPGDRIVMSWDIALSEIESGDYSACVVLLIRKEIVYILEVVRGRRARRRGCAECRAHHSRLQSACLFAWSNRAHSAALGCGRSDRDSSAALTASRAIDGEPCIFRLLVALLVRAWEIRTPAKLGVPDIFERRAGLIDKGVDNHDPAVPKGKIQNPGLGVATLRIADEMQFVGAKRTTFGFHCLYGTLPRRKLQARQQFFGQGGAGNLKPRWIIPAGGIVCRFLMHPKQAKPQPKQ